VPLLTEKTAKQRGYTWTAIYGRRLQEIQDRCDKIKEQGFKAIVVRVPDNPLSRGPIGEGYSVYAEPLYNMTKTLKEYEERLARFPDERQYHTKEYTKKIDEINALEDDFRQRVARLTQEIKDLKTKG
jgi:hypothetical protein